MVSSFRCETLLGTSDLCFFGGSCIVSDSSHHAEEQFCQCAPGFGADNHFFHSANCAVPDYLVEAIFAVYSTVWAFILYVFVRRIFSILIKSSPVNHKKNGSSSSNNNQRKRKAKQGLVSLVVATLTYHFALELGMASMVLQKGLFEYGVFFFTVTCVSTQIMVALVLLQMFQFSNGVFPRKLERMNGIVGTAVGIGCGLISTAGTIGIVYCRTPWFDTIMIVLGIFHVCGVVGVLGLVAVRFTDQFQSLLQQAGGFAQVMTDRDRLVGRVQTIKNKWKMWIAMLNLSFWPILIVRQILGSVPFMWFLCVGAFWCNLFATLGILSLLPDHSKTTTVQHRAKTRADPCVDQEDQDATTIQVTTVTAPMSSRIDQPSLQGAARIMADDQQLCNSEESLVASYTVSSAKWD